MGSEAVTYERSGRVGVITIDRPPVNAYDSTVELQLQRAWIAAASDDGARAVVLLAEGEHFCAGADLSKAGAESAHPQGHIPERAPMNPWEEMEFVRTLPKPTLVAVQGACVGGGQRHVFACDLIFCSEDAFFRDPLVQVGGVGGIPAPVHVWLYGPRLAKEMLYSGEPVPAQRLHQLGAVNRLLSRAALHSEAVKFAEQIAEADPAALRQAKRSVNMTMDLMGQHYVRDRFAELMDEMPSFGWSFGN